MFMNQNITLRDFLMNKLSGFRVNSEVSKMIINSIKSYGANRLRPTEIIHPTIVATNEELFEVAASIFKSTNDPELFKLFNLVVNQKPSLIDIEYVNRKIELPYRGVAYFDTYNKFNYTKIVRHNSYLDIYALVHELFHIIIRKDFAVCRTASPKYVYHEVEGHFADFLVHDYIKDHTNDEYVKRVLDIEDSNIFRNMEMISKCFAVTEVFIQAMIECDHIQLKDVRRRINNLGLRIPVNLNNLGGYLEEEHEYEGYVAFCYLIAIDIYDIYKKDPERGVYLLKKIPKLKGEKIKQELSSVQVTFFEDGHQNLRNKGQELTKRLK